MTTHTPGPWHTESNQFTIWDEKHAIAAVYNTMAPEPMAGQARANAQLIAAAPELLESCQELVKMVEELLPLAPAGCGWGTLATDQARAAVAKALGQETMVAK